MRKIFAVDVDGIFWPDDYPNTGDVDPDAVRTCNAILDMGHSVVIWTCRSGEKLRDALDVLGEAGLRWTCVNANPQRRIEEYGGDCRKISADMYIDDRQPCKMWCWDDIYAVAKYWEEL